MKVKDNISRRLHRKAAAAHNEPASAPPAMKIKMRLTMAGWLFFIVTIMLALAAGKSQAAMVFLLFGAAAGVLVVSMIVSFRMVSGAVVHRDLPERAWQNQTVHVGYHIRNSNRIGSILGLTVEEVNPSGIDSIAGYCMAIPPRQVFRAGGRFVARRRGKISLTAIAVRTTFPFGLVRASKIVSAEVSLLVWPARGRLKRQVLSQGAVENSDSPASLISGGQDEFFGLREYRVGDNPRWIHWRRSAGKTLPVVREMAQPLPEVLWLIVDTCMDGIIVKRRQQREQLLRLAGTLIDHALRRGYKVGMAIGYRNHIAVYRPDEGKGQRTKLLDSLAEVNDNLFQPLSELMRHLSGGQLAQSQAVLLALEENESTRKAGQAMRGNCRNLSVISSAGIEAIFEDDALASKENADAV